MPTIKMNSIMMPEHYVRGKINGKNVSDLRDIVCNANGETDWHKLIGKKIKWPFHTPIEVAKNPEPSKGESLKGKKASRIKAKEKRKPRFSMSTKSSTVVIASRFGANSNKKKFQPTSRIFKIQQIVFLNSTGLTRLMVYGLIKTHEITLFVPHIPYIKFRLVTLPKKPDLTALQLFELLHPSSAPERRRQRKKAR